MRKLTVDDIVDHRAYERAVEAERRAADELAQDGGAPA